MLAVRKDLLAKLNVLERVFVPAKHPSVRVLHSYLHRSDHLIRGALKESTAAPNEYRIASEDTLFDSSRRLVPVLCLF